MKVFKYRVPITDNFELVMSKGAKILCLQLQHGIPHFWALVDDPQTEFEIRRFHVAGTGHPIDRPMEYIGTIQTSNDALVFHYFEDLG